MKWKRFEATSKQPHVAKIHMSYSRASSYHRATRYSRTPAAQSAFERRGLRASVRRMILNGSVTTRLALNLKHAAGVWQAIPVSRPTFKVVEIELQEHCV